MKRVFVAIALATALAGCANQRPTVTVQALADPTSQSLRRYVLYPGNQGANATDLEFRTYAEQVSNMMGVRGYTMVGAPEQADLLVTLKYSTSGPHTTTTTSAMPMWGQTGYSSAQTYGTVGPGGNYSSTTNFTPTYGVTGYMPITSSHTFYAHAVRLTAFGRNPTSQEIQEMWNVTGSGISNHGDLRGDFWAFMQAMAPYVGLTQHEIDVPIEFPKQ